jgi:hypothetical protein
MEELSITPFFHLFRIFIILRIGPLTVGRPPSSSPLREMKQCLSESCSLSDNFSWVTDFFVGDHFNCTAKHSDFNFLETAQLGNIVCFRFFRLLRQVGG